jgi:hypothetical protein
VLFYSYSDALKGRHMIATSAEENNTAREVVDANLDALNAMVGASAQQICTAICYNQGRVLLDCCCCSCCRQLPWWLGDTANLLCLHGM